MDPDNGIMGDMDGGISLPVAQTDEEALEELKRKAKVSKSREFKNLKANMRERMDFYSQFLPGGTSVLEMTNEERGKYWAIANVIIMEFQAVISEYDGSVDLLKDLDDEQK